MMDKEKILAEFTRKMADYTWEETTPEIIVKVLTEILTAIDEEGDNLPKVANKCTEKAMRESRIHIGSDFNEFYIEALEATILDLTGKRVEDKKKLENKIAKRIIDEWAFENKHTSEEMELLNRVIYWLDSREERWDT